MREHFPFGYTFLIGLIAGMAFMNLEKSMLLENTGLLDEDTLYHMKYMTVDGSALFAFVLRKRIGCVMILGILATTYLGLAVCVGASFIFGWNAGAFVSAAVLRFGIKGLLLVLAGIMPQALFYAPAFYALILWCEGIYRYIYAGRRYPGQTETPAVYRRVMRALIIVGVVLLGCAVESFVNPSLLLGLLQVF